MSEEVDMIGTLDQARTQLIARHIATGHARDLVARALYESVLDGLEFGPRDLPRPEDREWIRGAIALPLQEATEAALETLAKSVGRALERAPDRLLERFERSHEFAEMGFE